MIYKDAHIRNRDNGNERRNPAEAESEEGTTYTGRVTTSTKQIDMLQVLNDESIFEDPTQCHFDFEEDGEKDGENFLVLVSATPWVRDKLKHAVSKSAKRITLKQLDYQIEEEPVDAVSQVSSIAAGRAAVVDISRLLFERLRQ